MHIDGSGRLWVNDAGNSRVLRFDNAASASNGADADAVLGQADFTSWRVNRGSVPAANTLHWPDAGLGGDNQGGLWVADRWGDRVLWFQNASSKSDGDVADGVIGQPNFTSKHGLVDINSFNSVTDVYVDTGNEHVWVVDNAHNRVLRFEAAAATLAKAPDREHPELPVVPSAYALYQNYPNPFSPITHIGFDLPAQVHVELIVYDLLGRQVHTLIDGMVAAGQHEVTFDAANLPSGVYLYRLHAGRQILTKKMLLAR